VGGVPGVDARRRAPVARGRAAGALRHTAPSNEAFDRGLRARDPAWGVRDLDEVSGVAGHERLRLDEIVAMPSNNLSVVFRATG
jgi:hypothetical protein